MRKLFAVALEDLAELVLEDTIVFCEGEDPTSDEMLLGQIFNDMPNVSFVSSTNKLTTKLAVAKYTLAVSRGLAPKRGKAVVDMDGLTCHECDVLFSDSLRVLRRYSLENYLLDPEIVALVCDRGFDRDKYVAFLADCASKRLERIRHKIKESRERESLAKGRPEEHPLLSGAVGVTPVEFETWFPLAPGKLFVGEVLEWIKRENLSTKVAPGVNLDSRAFLEKLARSASMDTSIKAELRSVLFGNEES